MPVRYGDSAQKMARAKVLLRAGGLTYQQIATEVGTSKSQIQRAADEIRDGQPDEQLTNGASIHERAGDEVTLTMSHLALLNAVMDRVEALEERYSLLFDVVHDMRDRLVGLRDFTKRHVGREEWDAAVRGRES